MEPIKVEIVRTSVDITPGVEALLYITFGIVATSVALGLVINWLPVKYSDPIHKFMRKFDY